MFLHGKSQEWTCDPWRFRGCRGPQRFTLIPLLPALPGWELWFTTPRQAEATKLYVASADPEQKRHVYTCLGSPLPVVMTTSIIRTSSTAEGGKPKTCCNNLQWIHAKYARFWILIIWRRLWPVIQSQPSAACTTRALGIPDSCILPRGRITVYGWKREEERLLTSCCTLSFWFGNTPCGLSGSTG